MARLASRNRLIPAVCARRWKVHPERISTGLPPLKHERRSEFLADLKDLQKVGVERHHFGVPGYFYGSAPLPTEYFPGWKKNADAESHGAKTRAA